MNRVSINLDALLHNLKITAGWMKEHGAAWTVVTKVLCGNEDVLKALEHMGVCSAGDSRLFNMRALKRIFNCYEGWYLRVPGPSVIDEVASLADVSLNSEMEMITALNEAAIRFGKKHHVVIMIELGDLREGILPGSLTKFYESVFNLSNIEVLGIGANLGCLAGVVPGVDQFMQLILYRELLELKFKHKLPLISAGSSAALPMVLNKQAPRAINHFRIGESLFLGTDLINGGILPGLRDDVMRVRAEIVELKEKRLVSAQETAGIAPFDMEMADNGSGAPGRRGYRALIGLGQLDTDINGLTPVNPKHQIAGASSDITVINLGDNPGGLKVGDTIEFKVNYSALLRLMNCRYIEKVVTPSVDKFTKTAITHNMDLRPVLEALPLRQKHTTSCASSSATCGNTTIQERENEIIRSI